MLNMPATLANKLLVTAENQDQLKVESLMVLLKLQLVDNSVSMLMHMVDFASMESKLAKAVQYQSAHAPKLALTLMEVAFKEHMV